MRGAAWSAPRAYVQLFSGDIPLVLSATVIAAVQSGLLLPVALLVRDVFDEAIPQHHASRVVLDAGAVLLLYLGSAVLALVSRRMVLVATRRGLLRLRTALLERLHGLPMSFFDKTSQSWVHSVVVQDTERLDYVAGTAISDLLPSALATAGLLVVALYLDPRLCLVLVIVLPLLLAVSRLLARGLGRQVAHWQQVSTAFSAAVQVSLTTMVSSKVRDAGDQRLREQTPLVMRLADSRQAMAWRQAAWSVTQGSVAAAVGVVVLVLGGTSVSDGSSSIGGLLGFYAVLALILRQVSGLLSSFPQLVVGAESLHRIRTFLDGPVEPPYAGRRSHDFAGDVALNGVTFGYEEQPVLRDVSLHLEPGEHVAVMGPNGSGKSTLAALVLGLYRPWSGHLTADGQRYDDIDLRCVRSGTGVVLQETYLSAGSVRDNICLGREDVSEEELARVVALAGLDEVLVDEARGLDTEVGDDGHLLSGGQRQRIALARALLGSPSLVVLDEPTNHLDHASIQRLHAALRSLPGGPTILTITHDPQVAALAERVIHLREGKVFP